MECVAVTLKREEGPGGRPAAVNCLTRADRKSTRAVSGRLACQINLVVLRNLERLVGTVQTFGWMLATKSDNQSSIPGTHMVKGEVASSKLFLTSTHVPCRPGYPRTHYI